MSVHTVEQALSEMRLHAEKFTEYVDFVYNRADKAKLAELAEMRRFSTSVLERHQVFYVPKSAASLMVPKYADNLRSFGVLSEQNKPVFYDRWVFPIRNRRGQVVNLVGYSNTARYRYLFGKGLYYDRRNTLFGLENLSVAAELGYAIITEGITDTIRLRDMGFANTFAMCGTGSSTFIYGQINRRVDSGVICIPDRDEAGQKALKNWKFKNRYVLWVDPQFKDVDEMCRRHPDGIAAARKAINRVVENLGVGYLSSDASTIRVSKMVGGV